MPKNSISSCPCSCECGAVGSFNASLLADADTGVNDGAGDDSCTDVGGRGDAEGGDCCGGCGDEDDVGGITDFDGNS